MFKKIKVIVFVSFCSVIAGCSYGQYPDEGRGKDWTYLKNHTPKPKPRRYVKNTPKKISYKTSGRNQQAIRWVKVTRGDTVYGISKRQHITLRSLIRQNNLRAPYLLKVGQKLKVPIYQNYRVKKGDTVYSLSRKSGLDIQSFTRINSLRYPYRLYVGQSLNIRPFKAKNQKIRIAKKINKKPSKLKKKYSAKTKKTAPKSKWIKYSAYKDNKFIWPVKGRIISSYGSKPHGLYNDGINILAKVGHKVVASDHGIVVHTSNKLKGYGNLILIKHSNGWMTAYAHNSRILVRKGQEVKRGQTIGAVGRTGHVKKPQLHFELRKILNTVNPIKYLPKA